MDSTAPPSAVRIRKRRRRRSRTIPLWPLWILALVAAVAGLVWFVLGRVTRQAPQGVAGYISDPMALAQEYARLYGKGLEDHSVEQDFQYAAALMLRGDYHGAISQLEGVAKRAAVPCVYNDLGVLYAEIKDGARAINSFRKAFSVDGDYQPVRSNLARRKALLNAADPVGQEVEPNDNYLLANVIALGAPVEADVSAYNDTDCFRFQAPGGPRDILAIEVKSDSKQLLPAFSVFDTDDRFLGWSQQAKEAGGTLTQFIAPQPNNTFILHLWGYQNTSGKYVLTVRPMKAFDQYEPNDDILNPHHLAIGQTIEANIMDGADNDFYSFTAPESGQVRVEIKNRSVTLIPALTVFTPDRRTSGFGPDIRTAGADLRHSFPVKPKQTYYIQVWSQANTAGAYSLSIE